MVFLLIGLAVFLVGARYAFNSFFSPGAKLNNYVKAYVAIDQFRGSVLVAKNGKVLLCKGYGMANYEHDIPNTPQTKFRLASITKQFTAMAIMQLKEKGLLSVNDTLSKYIPDYPNGDKINIHHLLTHTSGIPNLPVFPESKKKKLESYTLEQRIELFKHAPLAFKPGEKYSYNNSGYILLNYIIEKVSGKTYETILKENIFDPLGMNNSGYDKVGLIIKDRASGYSLDGSKFINAAYIDMSYVAGAGALYSTVEDLYLWDQALYSEKLLPKKSLAALFTPYVVMDQSIPDSFSYGYGWRIGKIGNHNFVGHTGRFDGFKTNICRYPGDNISIIVLSNFDHSNISQLSSGLAAIVFGEPYELPKKRIAIVVDPQIYDQYVGKYRLKKDFILTVTKEDNKLIAQATGQGRVEIYPESETEFFNEAIDAQISFAKDEKGKVTKLILHQGGMDQGAEKIE